MIAAASEDDAPLAALLDRHFDGRPGLLDEFPLLVGQANRRRCRVIERAGAYLAHAAWRPMLLVSGRERIRCAGIGLVTTHAAHRGAGLATRLIEACVDDARGEGAELALLFSPPRALYGRVGFVAAGRELTAWAPRSSARTSGASAAGGAACLAVCRPARPDDLGAVLALSSAHTLRVERTARELGTLLAIPAVRAWVAERAGAVGAYCVVGKGRDLGGVVHEWGGTPDVLEALLGHLSGAYGAALPILAPVTTPPACATRGVPGQLALMRILAPSRLGTADPVRAFGHAAQVGDREIYVWGLDSV